MSALSAQKTTACPTGCLLYTSYHLFDDRTIPDQYEQTVPQVFPNTAPGNFTWCEEMHKWVLTTFHDYQWDLNYANPAVFVDMTKSILHLANLGVEVFRIDAVPYIWKQLGTTCRNLPQVHTIVRMLRMVLECVCPAVPSAGGCRGLPRHPTG